MTEQARPQIVLLTGANGQLGSELQRRSRHRSDSLHAFDKQALDITQAPIVNRIVDELHPDVIINAAAYTAVDRAEEAPAEAFAVNRDGPSHLAAAARRCGARMIHVSTDFVFDGAKGCPYKPLDKPEPQGVYGASKAEGERAVREILEDRALIVRTAWVYSVDGSNFVNTMLRLMGELDELRVVADQVGSPTWARRLADCIWRALECRLSGIHHWTDAGMSSWYDFAVAIQEEALWLGLLARRVPIMPITTSEYPTPAKRPNYSVLEKSQTWRALEVTAEHWRESLRHMLKEVGHKA